VVDGRGVEGLSIRGDQPPTTVSESGVEEAVALKWIGPEVVWAVSAAGLAANADDPSTGADAAAATISAPIKPPAICCTCLLERCLTGIPPRLTVVVICGTGIANRRTRQ
jgi:hypothetical protein